MSDITPYKNLPDYAFWRRAVANKAINDVDPVVKASFSISKTDKIATAGSCFAQHIARVLKENGLNFYITEQVHPLIDNVDSSKYNYGIFSARYGNIYTAKQLLQLFDRAYDSFRPREDYWKSGDGFYIDPFRPQIQPSGFVNLLEFYAERKQHFSCVRNMFENMDVFIFTLGLTECWLSNDGAVYPVCPGVVGGCFDKDKYLFKNFNVEDTTNDLLEFITKLNTVNSKCRVILTVSPVPLVATAVDRHVLTSTTYSKSVLRVAADYVTKSFDNVYYFPSYEIITGNFNRGQYFAEDLRSVTTEGVNHVMSLFLKHYANLNLIDAVKGKSGANRLNPLKLFKIFTKSKKINGVSAVTESKKHLNEMENIINVLCDEEALDKH